MFPVHLKVLCNYPRKGNFAPEEPKNLLLLYDACGFTT